MKVADFVVREKELQEVRGGTAEAIAQLEQLLVKSEMAAAVAAAKGNLAFLRLHVEPRLQVRKVDGRRVVVVLGEAGHPRVADGSGRLMTVKDLLAEMREDPDFALGFEPDGAPVDRTKAPAPGKPLVISRDDAKNPARYQAMKAQAAKEGREFKIAPPRDQEPPVVVPPGAVTIRRADALSHPERYQEARRLAAERGVEFRVVPDEP